MDSTTFSVGAIAQAVVLPDPFDPADKIESVDVHYTLSPGGTGVTALAKGANGSYSWTVNDPRITEYKIVARNTQGLSRETPTYRVAGVVLSVVHNKEPGSSIYPNPTTKLLTAKVGKITRILTTGGHEIMLASAGSSCVDVSRLPAGAYLVEIMSRGASRTEKFVKQ
jgi:hypothetical protein